MPSGTCLSKHSPNRLSGVIGLIALASLVIVPSAFAQSPEASAEWGLFNQILFIGILVGMVVFGIMFYAIIRYRERPRRDGAQ